jgi:hypothetical protein
MKSARSVVLPQQPCLEERIHELVFAFVPVNHLELNQPIQGLLD